MYAKSDVIKFYSYILEHCHWTMTDIVVKEMKEDLEMVDYFGLN